MVEMATLFVEDPKKADVRASLRELPAGQLRRPGSVATEEFTAVRPRGPVQHLAARVTGRLRPEAGPWDSFASLFPAITATAVSKPSALQALARHEEGPRGLYGGAVFRGSTPSEVRPS